VTLNASTAPTAPTTTTTLSTCYRLLAFQQRFQHVQHARTQLAPISSDIRRGAAAPGKSNGSSLTNLNISRRVTLAAGLGRTFLHRKDAARLKNKSLLLLLLYSSTGRRYFLSPIFRCFTAANLLKVSCVTRRGNQIFRDHDR
jgi:hypothetical protein